MDYSTWLTKQQAGEAIGCSTKTVEKFVQEGKLQQASWRRPTGGPVLAVYHPGDVARIAQERHPGAAPFVLPAVVDAADGNGGGGGGLALTPPPVAPSPGDDVLRQVFAAALRAVTSETSGTSETSQTLFLTLAQASAVSGLSQRCLRRLIDGGTLAALRDRGWRIRRRDLEAL